MSTFTRKPEVYEAFQVGEDTFAKGAEHDAALTYDAKRKLVTVPTRDGGKIAREGDYVAKDQAGHFSVFSAEDFEAYFEATTLETAKPKSKKAKE